jgi:hypothetical protein
MLKSGHESPKGLDIKTDGLTLLSVSRKSDLKLDPTNFSPEDRGTMFLVTLVSAYKLLLNFSLAPQPQFGPRPTTMKISFSLWFTRSYTLGRTPWGRG